MSIQRKGNGGEISDGAQMLTSQSRRVIARIGTGHTSPYVYGISRRKVEFVRAYNA